MSENYKVAVSEVPHFITITVVDWIDVFTKPVYKDIIVNSIKYCQKEKGLIVHAWVIMTNHLHMIVSSRDVALQDIIRDFKKFTSKKITEAIQINSESRKKWMLNQFGFEAKRSRRTKDFKFWRDGFHPIQLDTNNMIDQRLEYLHYNPVAQGIVDEEERYIYSSARDYCGEKGLIDIEFIE